MITLQFGRYANFVGSHYWNLQQEYINRPSPQEQDIYHSVMFRQEQSRLEEKYIPRVICVDLKQQLISKYTPSQSDKPSLSVESVESTWSGKAQKYENHVLSTCTSEPPHDQIEESTMEQHNTSQTSSQSDQEDRSKQYITPPLDLDTLFNNWPDFLTVKYNSKSMIELPYLGSYSDFDFYYQGFNILQETENVGFKF
jgi:hypothetical protein